MFFDPLYMLIFFIGLIIITVPQMYVSRTYKKYLKVNASSGLTGGDVAREILRYNGLSDVVTVESIPGSLSDHYDSRSNTIRLSEENYFGRSISAVSVSAHEVGHAIQANKNYFPIKVREAFFPIASLGDKLGSFLLFAGLLMMFLMGIVGLGKMIAIIGVILYGAVVLFQFLTLPVEFNASTRALTLLRNYDFVSATEIALSRKVLTAAALTYFAAALFALINLFYYLYILFGNRD